MGMKKRIRKRDLRLEKYGISKNRYRELQAFCLQYPEWQAELFSKLGTVGSPGAMGTPPGKNMSCSDSTANLAIRCAMLSEKCKIVEKSAEEACDDAVMQKFILKNVCQGISFQTLKAEGIPCERDSFYDSRRYFFYILDKRIEKSAYNDYMKS